MPSFEQNYNTIASQQETNASQKALDNFALQNPNLTNAKDVFATKQTLESQNPRKGEAIKDITWVLLEGKTEIDTQAYAALTSKLISNPKFLKGLALAQGNNRVLMEKFIKSEYEKASATSQEKDTKQETKENIEEYKDVEKNKLLILSSNLTALKKNTTFQEAMEGFNAEKVKFDHPDLAE